MLRILLIDDDEATRKMIRRRLKNQYEIVDTGDPSEALALALEHKPNCILLDLSLPRFSGLELCQTFCSLSHTRSIPIFVITGRTAEEYKESCLNLGATEFFQKPIDFARLKSCLEALPADRWKGHRGDVRVQLKVSLRLTGKDGHGKDFELLTMTDEVSVEGFSCHCVLPLEEGAVVEVYQLGGVGEHQVGWARVVHTQWRDLPWQSCGFQFIEKTGEWILMEEKTGAWAL